ncbi:hypothetical protein [Mycoplasma bradburyae]|uniref:hypothetical protein n=1 Tax=Mycoplasma bradburyae TaxID=2963128 RepID=UPI0023420AB9|nr:hypothetical protein [Mycoplasma bradburyae]MDC4184278.1 hypothetical protein [Mycoplasma bradburyae]
MSHSAVLHIQNEDERQELLNSCTRLNDLLLDLKKNTTKQQLLDEIEHRLEENNKLLDSINANRFVVNWDNPEYDIQKLTSSIDKKIALLFSFSDQLENQLAKIKSSDINSINLIELSEKYGDLVFEAIDSLNNDNQTINESSVCEKIDELINREASLESRQKFKIDCLKLLSNAFPNDEKLRKILYELTIQVSTNLELIDFKAYIWSKKNALDRIKGLANKIYAALKNLNEGYQQIAQPIFLISEEGELKVQYEFKNKLKESFVMTISESLNVMYKIGDYERHCCEKTSNFIVNYLNKNNAKVLSKNLIREFHNVKPKYKAMEKQKTKHKEKQ